MIKSRPDFGPPPPALMDAIGALTVDGFRDGYLLDAGGLAETSRAENLTATSLHADD